MRTCRRGNYGRKVRTKLSYPPSDISFIGSSTAPRGVLWGAITCSVYAFLLTIFFLFCTPDIDHLLSFRGPQLFVFVYSQALGRTGAVFMTVLAALGLICVRPVVFV